MGEFCPLRIPFDRLRAAASPTDKLRKDSTLPPVTTKKSIVFHAMTKIVRFFKDFISLNERNESYFSLLG
jgi:hypothetical protein